MTPANDDHAPEVPANVTSMPAAAPPVAPEAEAPSSPPSSEEIKRLTRMHLDAADLNRVTIHTNFQQAIQEAILDPKQRKDLSRLAASFHQWADGEVALRQN